MTFFITEMS